MKRIYLIAFYFFLAFIIKMHSATRFNKIIEYSSTKNKEEPLKTRFDTLDDYARKTPKEYEENVKKLANYLIQPAKSDMEKARLLFTWVATHVKYDVSAYNSGGDSETESVNIIKKKRAVCEGYSNLLRDLCIAAGLEAEKVVGYAKGYGYKEGQKFSRTDHAWNAIKIDGEWKLFDATWASGYGTKVDGKLKLTMRFEPYWFNVNPKEFIFSHLPEDEQWQLLNETISLHQFEKAPNLNDAFFKLQFDADKVFEDAISGTVEEFATVYSAPADIKGVQLPYTRTLKKSESVTFILQSDNTSDMVLIDGKEWIPFTKDGSTFTLTHAPQHKKIFISIKKNKNSEGGMIIIEYKIKK